MKHRIIVLGAGYAGASAAGRLARRLHPEDTEITLVNAAPDFVERVRLHQIATGQDLASRPLADMFDGTGVRVHLARVTAVDADRKTVALSSADGGTDELGYDTLVYALGSNWDPQGVPGVAEHAHEIASRPGALRLRERLAALEAGANVTVVGGGLTGIEAATEIAETRPDLNVALTIRGDLGQRHSPRGRTHLRQVADRLGITVHERTEVTAVESEAVTTEAGVIRAAVTVWTTGFAVHPIADVSGLKTAESGQIVVDRTMRSVSHPDVYAVGDAAYAMGPGDSPLRMSCASGIPAAWQAADAIAARLTGGRLPKRTPRYFNQCISLGRKEGLIQYVTADDRARPYSLRGRGAAVYKELVCKGAAWGVAHPTLGMPVRRKRLAKRATAAERTAAPA